MSSATNDLPNCLGTRKKVDTEFESVVRTFSHPVPFTPQREPSSRALEIFFPTTGSKQLTNFLAPLARAFGGPAELTKNLVSSVGFFCRKKNWIPRKFLTSGEAHAGE